MNLVMANYKMQNEKLELYKQISKLQEEVGKLQELKKSLEKIIGIEDWDISNVTTMWAMFAFCEKLKLDLRHWDISDLCTTNLIIDGAPGVKLNQDKI